MRILFAISVLALAVLLWASFAIARHIRLVRREQRLRRSPDGSPSEDTGIAAPPLPGTHNVPIALSSTPPGVLEQSFVASVDGSIAPGASASSPGEPSGTPGSRPPLQHVPRSF